ncbi:MAG: hypothetical protein HN402_04080 [Candidatus Scalindua sp.]|nr:hypothetical protein [Candidatus Scalindua sp.]
MEKEKMSFERRLLNIGTDEHAVFFNNINIKELKEGLRKGALLTVNTGKKTTLKELRNSFDQSGEVKINEYIILSKKGKRLYAVKSENKSARDLFRALLRKIYYGLPKLFSWLLFDTLVFKIIINLSAKEKVFIIRKSNAHQIADLYFKTRNKENYVFVDREKPFIRKYFADVNGFKRETYFSKYKTDVFESISVTNLDSELLVLEERLVKETRKQLGWKSDLRLVKSICVSLAGIDSTKDFPEAAQLEYLKVFQDLTDHYRDWECLDIEGELDVKRVVRHGDITIANILRESKKTYLLDWEYSVTNGFPLTDLLNAIVKVYKFRFGYRKKEIEMLDHVFYKKNKFSKLAEVHLKEYCQELNLSSEECEKLFLIYMKMYISSEKKILRKILSKCIPRFIRELSYR